MSFLSSSSFTVLFLLSLAGLSVSSPTLSSRSLSTTVKLDYGTFKGSEANKLLSFKGIKYADAPRFKAPVFPPSAKLGDVDATQYGKGCPSGDSDKFDESKVSEECLYLNVWARSGTNSDAKLPVMVWIHGGGFTGGDGHTDPSMMMSDSASPFIFVSIDYRLGAYGFLAGKELSGDGSVNFGLQDQRASLKWIQKYISNFGGDPQKVTIWGQSAGAGSTMFHLIYNGGNNEGLFHQAMGDSPSASFTPPSDGEYAQLLFNDYAKNAGCTSGNTLDCLRKAKVETLAQAGSKLYKDRKPTVYPFAPSADGKLIKEVASEAFKNGNFSKVPLLFGSNTDDRGGPDYDGINEEKGYQFLKAQFNSTTKETFDQAVKDHYPLSSFNNDWKNLTAAMYGEARYTCAATMITGAAFKYKQKAFAYRYDNPNSKGLTPHAAELEAFFDASKGDGPSGLYKTMRQQWTSFVTSGDPKAGWTAVKSDQGDDRQYLHPGQVSMQPLNSIIRDRCDWWHYAGKGMSK